MGSPGELRKELTDLGQKKRNQPRKPDAVWSAVPRGKPRESLEKRQEQSDTTAAGGQVASKQERSSAGHSKQEVSGDFSDSRPGHGEADCKRLRVGWKVESRHNKINYSSD